MTSESMIRGYKAGRFSFNVAGGRCETCEGSGVRTIEMNFLPDVYVECETCQGKRFNRETLEIRYKGKSISEVLNMTVDEAVPFFELLPKIYRKLKTIQDVGLGYISMGQQSTTLSGGEAQRIKLAGELSKKDNGNTLYILDEPSIGLHPRDTKRLVGVLEKLRNIGNTVIVVEHEEEVMLAADQIIDIGPDAGNLGGHLVFQMGVKRMKEGTVGNLHASFLHDENTVGPNSHTYRFLTGQDQIEVPKFRRKWSNYIHLVGARENNLKGVTVKIPLLAFTVVTGVSGSGKSTLIKKVLYPALARQVGLMVDEGGKYEKISGGLNMIEQVEFVDQNPIGKSSRSNPVTYIKAYDQIRNLFAEQQLSKARGYTPGHFSFNIDGGRCDVCQGEGEVRIEMQFMADIYLKCEGCGGKRFKQEVQEVKFNNASISDVLNLTIDESLLYFADKPKIAEKLQPLKDVGLGYIKLGQSSNTLSGGEAQRVKLASFLSKGSDRKEKIMFIFDEPTTGLHFHDISKLLTAMQALVDQGNTVLVIEHNPEVIKCADWVIDMGPEGGNGGGKVCFEGTPEGLAALEGNHTGDYLKGKV
jgi:excinuclease ABC subunit A